MAKRPLPVPHNRGIRPLPNTSLGGWLGTSGMSAKDVAKFGLKMGVDFAKAAGNPVELTRQFVQAVPSMAKSIAGTATRLDDYATLIQANPGGKNDTRRLAAAAQVQGKGLQDLGNLALVLGAVKGATSPAGRQAAYDVRHALGQADFVGQPVRSAILNAEIKQLGRKTIAESIPTGPPLYSYPSWPNVPSHTRTTQVRNLFNLRSTEPVGYGDPLEYPGYVQKISKSPNLVRSKLEDAVGTEYGAHHHPEFSNTIAQEIERSGLREFDPVYVRRSEGRSLLADGHHRVIVGNFVDPKMEARYTVDRHSVAAFQNPYYNARQTVARTIQNLFDKVQRQRALRQTTIYQQAHNPNFVPSSGLRAFLNEIKTPSSFGSTSSSPGFSSPKYAEIEFDPVTNTKIVRVVSKSPKKSSSKR